MNNRINKTDWLATVFYPLAVVLMEAFWVYPWLVWLGSFPAFSPPRPPLSLATVIIVLAAATLATRYFLRQKWSVGIARTIIVGAGLLVILAVLGIEYNAGETFLSGQWFAHIGQLFANIISRPDTVLIALPALLYLWWRGINLGQVTSYFRSIYRSFLLGMAALIALMIIWQVTASSGALPKPGPGAGLDVIAFFFFGLLAIAISHLYTMRSAMVKEEAGLTSVWRWLPIMLAVTGGMALVVFGIAGVFSPGFFAAVGHGIGVAFDFFWKIFNYILIPFNFIFDFLFMILQWLVNRLRSPEQQPNDSANTSLGDIFPKTAVRELPPYVTETIKWLVIAAIVGAVLFVLARAVSRFRARRAAEEIEEINESIFSWRGLGKDLREILGLMGKKRKKPAPVPGYKMDADESRRMEVREIYWRMEQEASRSGLSRGRHETPTEYSERLGRALPDGRDPINKLTDMYVDVRYGEVRLPEEKVSRANSIWWRLYRSFISWRGQA